MTPCPSKTPVAAQSQPSLKGQFCFISSWGEDSPSDLHPFSHSMPSPYLGAISPLLPIHCPLSNLPSPSTPMPPCPWSARTPRPGSQLWGRVLSTRQRELSPAPAFSSSEQDTGTRVTSESFCSACREDSVWGEGSKTPRPTARAPFSQLEWPHPGF